MLCGKGTACLRALHPTRGLVTSAAAAGDKEITRARRARRPPSGGAPRSRGGTERAVSSSVAAAQAQPAPAVDMADGEGAEPVGSTPHRSISVLNRYRALLLDSTYRPVGVTNWQRAVCLDLADKADVLEYYSEDVTVRSVREEFYLPAVLRVRTHRSKAQHTVVSLSRSNILLRDRYQCQYCGSGRDLTIDHVVPQSKGGGNTWENLVTCCASCNSKKGSKSLEQLRWKLRQTPKEPSIHEIDFLLSMLLGSNNHELLPEQWQAYILPFKTPKTRMRQQHAG